MNFKTILIGLATVSAYLFVISKTPLAPMIGLQKTGNPF